MSHYAVVFGRNDLFTVEIHQVTEEDGDSVIYYDTGISNEELQIVLNDYDIH
jgi:hypothetical protein